MVKIKQAIYVEGWDKAIEQASREGKIDIACPWCHNETSTEPDTYEYVKCEICQKMYEIRGIV